VSVVKPSLSPYQHRALTALYQHRLLTTAQLHALLLDHGRNLRRVQERLAELRAGGLVDAVRGPGLARPWVWFVTNRGAARVEAALEVPVRPYRVTPEQAAGPKQQHALAVAEVAVAWTAQSRQPQWAGVLETGPLDWTPEVGHRLTERPAGPALIVDAVLRVAVVDDDGRRAQHTAMVEVDRAMMSTPRLIAKLGTYMRYYNYRPGAGRPGATVGSSHQAWRSLYYSFPDVLIVLAAPGNRAVDLNARLDALTTAAAPIVRRLDGSYPDFYACLMPNLIDSGPFSPIYTNLATREAGQKPFGYPADRIPPEKPALISVDRIDVVPLAELEPSPAAPAQGPSWSKEDPAAWNPELAAEQGRRDQETARAEEIARLTEQAKHERSRWKIFDRY
jgi:hypothetical protein